MKSLKDLGTKTFNGRTTVAIEGFPPNSTPGTSEVQTLYIASLRPTFPSVSPRSSRRRERERQERLLALGREGRGRLARHVRHRYHEGFP